MRFLRQSLDDFLRDNGSETVFDIEEEDLKMKFIQFAQHPYLHYIELDDRLPREQIKKLYKDINSMDRVNWLEFLPFHVRLRYIRVKKENDNLTIFSALSQGHRYQVFASTI